MEGGHRKNKEVESTAIRWLQNIAEVLRNMLKQTYFEIHIYHSLTATHTHTNVFTIVTVLNKNKGLGERQP